MRFYFLVAHEIIIVLKAGEWMRVSAARREKWVRNGEERDEKLEKLKNGRKVTKKRKSSIF